jgi:hypothetical protein
MNNINEFKTSIDTQFSILSEGRKFPLLYDTAYKII